MSGCVVQPGLLPAAEGSAAKRGRYRGPAKGPHGAQGPMGPHGPDSPEGPGAQGPGPSQNVQVDIPARVQKLQFLTQKWSHNRHCFGRKRAFSAPEKSSDSQRTPEVTVNIGSQGRRTGLPTPFWPRSGPLSHQIKIREVFQNTSINKGTEASILCFQNRILERFSIRTKYQGSKKHFGHPFSIAPSNDFASYRKDFAEPATFSAVASS